MFVRTPDELGAVIAQSRRSKKWDFADVAGVGRRFLSELDAGKPTAETGKVLQVLTALGIDLELRRR